MGAPKTAYGLRSATWSASFSSVRSIPREAVVDILYGTIATTENLATMELEGGHARREPLRDTARRACDGV